MGSLPQACRATETGEASVTTGHPCDIQESVEATKRLGFESWLWCLAAVPSSCPHLQATTLSISAAAARSDRWHQGGLSPPRQPHSRVFLCSSFRGSGDLLVAVHHLRHEPYGQHHNKHVHHDLRHNGRHVSVGCRGRTWFKEGAEAPAQGDTTAPECNMFAV